MTPKKELLALVQELDTRMKAYEKLPRSRRVSATSGIVEPFLRLADADPEFAIEMLWVYPHLKWRCREHIPDVVVRLGDGRRSISIVGRMRSLFSTAEKDLVRVAEAATEGSLLRQFALDEVLTIAAGINDKYLLARFCYFQVGWLQSLSPDHAARLMAMTGKALEGVVIEEYKHYYSVRDFLELLRENDLTPKARAELRGTFHEAEKFWKHESEIRGLRLQVERFEDYLANAPQSDEDYNEILEDLKGGSIEVWDENTGEVTTASAFDGKRICLSGRVSDSFYYALYALQELLWDDRADEIEIDVDWSGCDFVLLPDFPDYVEAIVTNQEGFDDCLEANGLAEIEWEEWRCEALDAVDTWFRIWIDEDLVIPIMKELWKITRYAAAIVLPRHKLRLQPSAATITNNSN